MNEVPEFTGTSYIKSELGSHDRGGGDTLPAIFSDSELDKSMNEKSVLFLWVLALLTRLILGSESIHFWEAYGSEKGYFETHVA